MYAKDRKTLLDRRELLKIKVKSLAEEARIIRKEERKTHGVLRHEMWDHRTKYLRAIARDTHIAYGLIRGRTLDQIEPKRYSEPNWDAIDKMIKKYGPKGGIDTEALKKAA